MRNLHSWVIPAIVATLSVLLNTVLSVGLWLKIVFGDERLPTGVVALVTFWLILNALTLFYAFFGPDED